MAVSRLAVRGLASTAFSHVGGFVSLCGDTFRAAFRMPFQFREFVEQTQFLIRVSLMPAILITIPFTVIIQFFFGQLLAEIGATDLSGAGAGLAVIKELGSFAAVLVIAGAGATAVCAELGARKIREEIDAMEVLGIDPIYRLVVPRVAAFVVVSVGLYSVVVVVGLLGSFAFAVLVNGASPGLFVANLTLLTDFVDLFVSEVKAVAFGIGAALVACYLGLNARGGPKGVGERVNQTIVFALCVLMVLNSVITAVYFQFDG